MPTIAPEMQPTSVALTFYSLEGNLGFPLMLSLQKGGMKQPTSKSSYIEKPEGRLTYAHKKAKQLASKQ